MRPPPVRGSSASDELFSEAEDFFASELADALATVRPWRNIFFLPRYLWRTFRDYWVWREFHGHPSTPYPTWREWRGDHCYGRAQLTRLRWFYGVRDEQWIDTWFATAAEACVASAGNGGYLA